MLLFPLPFFVLVDLRTKRSFIVVMGFWKGVSVNACAPAAAGNLHIPPSSVDLFSCWGTCRASPLFTLTNKAAVSIVRPPCALCGRVSLGLESLCGRLCASSALADKAKLFLQMLVAASTVPSNTREVLLLHGPRKHAAPCLLDPHQLSGPERVLQFSLAFLGTLLCRGKSCHLRWPFGSLHPPSVCFCSLPFTKSG